MSKLWRFALLPLLLTGVSGVRASGDTENSTAQARQVLSEASIPDELVIGGVVSEVKLVDELTAKRVPLRGGGTQVVDGHTAVLIPQLPPGTFTLYWAGGQRSIEVTDRRGVTVGYVAAESSNSSPGLPVGPLGVLALGGLVLVVVFRRNKPAMLLAACASFATGAVIILTGTFGATQTKAAVPWTVCDSHAVSAERLDCKVSTIITYGRAGAYDKIAALLANNTDPVCHEAAHRASFHLWRTAPNTQSAQDLLIPGCDDGFIHGFVESIATFSADNDVAAAIASFCNQAEAAFSKKACFHGGGHATIWRTNGDLYAAWKLCAAFPDISLRGASVRTGCQGSAVMEWADRWSEERNGIVGVKTLRPELAEPMEVCTAGPRDDLFRLECYLGTNHRTGSAVTATQWCLDREPLKAACFSALGENLPYFVAPNLTDPFTAEASSEHGANCRKGNDTQAEACMRSLARVFTVMKVSSAQGAQLCKLVETSLQAACKAGIEDARERFAVRGLTLP